MELRLLIVLFPQPHKQWEEGPDYEASFTRQVWWDDENLRWTRHNHCPQEAQKQIRGGIIKLDEGHFNKHMFKELCEEGEPCQIIWDDFPCEITFEIEMEA